MSDSSVPKIEVADLQKSFRPEARARRVNITCGTGESLVVIGGSGTGKSVLIKCILGLLRPTAARFASMDRRPSGSAAPRGNSSCRNSACCSKAAPCSTRCGYGRMSHSVLSKGAACHGIRRARLRCRSSPPSGLAPDVAVLSRPSCRAACRSGFALARAIAVEPEILFFDEADHRSRPDHGRRHQQPDRRMRARPRRDRDLDHA